MEASGNVALDKNSGAAAVDPRPEDLLHAGRRGRQGGYGVSFDGRPAKPSASSAKAAAARA